MTARLKPLLNAPRRRRRAFIPFGSISMMLVFSLMAAGCSKQQQENAAAGGDLGYAQDAAATDGRDGNEPSAAATSDGDAHEAHPALEPFHGSWALDIDGTVELLPEAEQELARGFFQNLQIGMRFEANGRAKMSFASQGELVEQGARYSLAEQREDATVVELVAEDPAFAAEEGQRFVRASFLDEDTMRYDTFVKIDGVVAEETQAVVMHRIPDTEYDERFQGTPVHQDPQSSEPVNPRDEPIQAHSLNE